MRIGLKTRPGLARIANVPGQLTMYGAVLLLAIGAILGIVLTMAVTR